MRHAGDSFNVSSMSNPYLIPLNYWIQSLYSVTTLIIANENRMTAPSFTVCQYKMPTFVFIGEQINGIYLQECYQAAGYLSDPVIHLKFNKNASSLLPFGWTSSQTGDWNYRGRARLKRGSDLTQQSQFEWVTDLARFVNECVITTQHNTSRANIPVTFVPDQENRSHVLEISSTSTDYKYVDDIRYFTIKSSGCRVCFARFLRYYSESARLDRLECNAGFEALVNSSWR